ALFGLSPSPFLLNGVIKQHLEVWQDRLPETVTEVSKSMYVDDFISGATTVPEAKKLKDETSQIFNDAQFELHKWNSNVEEPETDSDADHEQSFAKQQLGQPTCQGEICCQSGEYPVFISDSTLLAEKLVAKAQKQRYRWNITLTMVEIRQKFWIPRLRKLTKRVLKSCWGCKRFRATPGYIRFIAQFIKHETDTKVNFYVSGKDCRSHLHARQRNKGDKAYVVLYSCSLTRAVFLELLSSSEFNLSRAPWWGGQFERLIGLMKSAFYKVVGQGLLSWAELTEVLLDVEVTLNNRPLTYMEKEMQLPLLFLNTNILPELAPYHLEQKDLKKRAKFLLQCKRAMWKRWTSEYLRALREQHRLKSGGTGSIITEGDVVIIKSVERNRNHWPLGIRRFFACGETATLTSFHTCDPSLKADLKKFYQKMMNSRRSKLTDCRLYVPGSALHPKLDRLRKKLQPLNNRDCQDMLARIVNCRCGSTLSFCLLLWSIKTQCIVEITHVKTCCDKSGTSCYHLVTRLMTLTDLLQTITGLLEELVMSLLPLSTLLQDDNNLFQTYQQLGTSSPTYLEVPFSLFVLFTSSFVTMFILY
ncbi:Hypothetical predicted protein, partial [Paramuricea clavata]